MLLAKFFYRFPADTRVGFEWSEEVPRDQGREKKGYRDREKRDRDELESPSHKKGRYAHGRRIGD